MSDEVIQVRGLREVQKALFSYSQQLGDKVMLAAVRQGANLVRKVARASVGKRTRTLERGIIVSKSKIYRARPGADVIGVFLTIRKNKSGSKKKDPFYGRFIEDGWNVRGKSNQVGAFNRRGKFRFSRAVQTAVFGKKTGRVSLPGKRDIPGKLFIKGSFEKNKRAAADLIVQSAERGAEVVKSKLRLR